MVLVVFTFMQVTNIGSFGWNPGMTVTGSVAGLLTLHVSEKQAFLLLFVKKLCLL
jgi:hypothetical protein